MFSFVNWSLSQSPSSNSLCRQAVGANEDPLANLLAKERPCALGDVLERPTFTRTAGAPLDAVKAREV